MSDVIAVGFVVCTVPFLEILSLKHWLYLHMLSSYSTVLPMVALVHKIGCVEYLLKVNLMIYIQDNQWIMKEMWSFICMTLFSFPYSIKDEDEMGY